MEARKLLFVCVWYQFNVQLTHQSYFQIVRRSSSYPDQQTLFLVDVKVVGKRREAIKVKVHPKWTKELAGEGWTIRELILQPR